MSRLHGRAKNMEKHLINSAVVSNKLCNFEMNTVYSFQFGMHSNVCMGVDIGTEYSLNILYRTPMHVEHFPSNILLTNKLVCFQCVFNCNMRKLANLLRLDSSHRIKGMLHRPHNGILCRLGEFSPNENGNMSLWFSIASRNLRLLPTIDNKYFWRQTVSSMSVKLVWFVLSPTLGLDFIYTVDMTEFYN